MANLNLDNLESAETEVAETEVVSAEVNQLDQLIAGLQNRSISIATLSENTGASFGYCQKMIYAPIAGAIYDPEAINAEGVKKVLLFKKIDLASFSMDGWKLPERKVNPFAGLKFAVGDLITAPKSCGKQSPDCQYKVEWTNASHILLVPFANYATDEAGIANLSPRVMAHSVLATLEPAKIG